MNSLCLDNGFWPNDFVPFVTCIIKFIQEVEIDLCT